MKPFIDFYNKENIIPVSQNVDDINFFFRRDYLYKTLGIPLQSLKGKNIIEFGPGGGYNALATSKYEPDLYVFVDASEASLDRLSQRKFGAKRTEIYQSEISNYKDYRKYDLVVCEGVLPCQKNPSEMLQHVASFSDCFLTATTMSATSILSEVCRRMLRPGIKGSFEEQTSIASGLFRSHFNNLQTMTRPIEDWVHDMILHDWHHGQCIFTMLDAVTTLPDFDFYSSSPRFIIDERWYKKASHSVSMSALLKQQYASFNVFLLDPRVPLKEAVRIKYAERIEEICAELCSIHSRIIDDNSYDELDRFISLLNELLKILPKEFSVTKESIMDFMRGIRKFADGDMLVDFGRFSNWWGMGQQYISFVKKFA